jgi:hypothetical protein
VSEQRDADAIEEHEDLDAETIFEDAKELFEKDNDQVPPAQPDAPPPDD